MRVHLLLSLFILFSIEASTQTVIGKVEDVEGKPIPFTNILILDITDSLLVKGTVSDIKGSYTIDGMEQGSYIVAATILGFQNNYFSPFNINEAREHIVPTFKLTPEIKQLDEVTVVSTRPFIEHKIDRTIINVANTLIAGGSTVLEILEKSPGIIVDRQSNAISLRGRQGVIVQIDGKQTHMATADLAALLRGMSSDSIERIELITSPSSNYDASGNAGIINIILKKNDNVGTNGSVTISGGSGRYDREQASGQISHRTKKVNIHGSFNANRSNDYWDFHLFRNQDDGDRRNVITQDSYVKFWLRSQSASIAMDYLLGNNTSIAVMWSGFWNRGREDSPAKTTFQRQESDPVYLQTMTDKTLSRVSFNQIGNFSIQHSISKSSEISADVNYGRFNRKFNNNLNTSTLIPAGNPYEMDRLFTQMPTSIDIVTVKLDYSLELKGNWRLELGIKSSSVKSDNNMTLSRGKEELRLDSTLSNHFQYSEKVKAAYVTVNGKLSPLIELKLGMRAERTSSVGESLSLNQKSKKNYFKLFPNLYISKKMSSKQNLTFSYSHRIDRPNYQDLNPARSYLDPFTFSTGNPFLQPQYTHSVELKHGYDQMVFTSLGASFVKDFVFYLLQPVDYQTVERIPENIGNSQSYNLNVDFPVTISEKWSIQASLMGVYHQLQYRFQGTPLTVKHLSGRANISNSFLLGKGWSSEISGWINSPTINSMFRSPWLGTVDIGLSKSIGPNCKAKLVLQDIFHTNRVIMFGNALDFRQDVQIVMDTRIVMASFTYSFGNQKLSSRQRKTGSEEEVQRAN